MAKVWENGTLKYTPGAPGADSSPTSVFAANGSLYTAGSEGERRSLDGEKLKDGDALYAYSVSLAVSQARSVRVSGGDVYAAGSSQSGLTKPLAVVWKTTRRTTRSPTGRPRRSERASAFRAGTPTPQATQAAPQRLEGQGAALHPDRRQFLCRSHRRLPVRTHLYTTGYHTDGFEEEGVVWKEGQGAGPTSPTVPGSGSMPYSVAVCYDDIFTAGTIFGTTRTAVVWHGDEIRIPTLSDGTGHS